MNRRIGDRRPVDIRDVSWSPCQDPRRRTRLRKPAPFTARLVDLSFTGASVVAPRGTPVGAQVAIAVDNLHGIVVVRRSTAIAGTTLARYGVEFHILQIGLRELVARTLDTHDPNHEWRWAKAR